MRWLALYARSRHVPASLVALLVGALAAGVLADGAGGPGDPRAPALVLAGGAMAVSVGLGGQDLALDRTAALRWLPRRAAHVLLAGTAVAGSLLAARALGADPAGTGFVVRDAAGLMGLAALGAAVTGGRYAWVAPFVWVAFVFFAPPPRSVPTQVASWPLLPDGTPAATWTAVTLAAVGTVAYAVAGPRR